MKPTIQQQDILSKYLRDNLRFRETYTEFYDHILTALENKPDEASFKNAVDGIIKEDFGGYEGMDTIERRYEKTVTKEIKSKYFNYLTGYLKSGYIGITVLLALLFYYITQQHWFGFLQFILLMFAMRLVTSLLLSIPRLIRNLKKISSHHIFRRSLRSVKDGVFRWLDYLPAMALLVVVIYQAFCASTPISWFKHTNPVVLTIILSAFAIHTLSFFRVYKDEFKVSIAQ